MSQRFTQISTDMNSIIKEKKFVEISENPLLNKLYYV